MKNFEEDHEASGSVMKTEIVYKLCIRYKAGNRFWGEQEKVCKSVRERPADGIRQRTAVMEGAL